MCTDQSRVFCASDGLRQKRKNFTSHSSPPSTIHVIFWLILWFVILFSLHYSLQLSPSLSPSNLPPQWLALPFWLVKHQPPTPTLLLTNVRGLETQMCLGSLGKFIIFLTFLYTVLNGFLLLAMSMQRQQMASTSCQHQRGPAVTPWQQSNRL